MIQALVSGASPLRQYLLPLFILMALLRGAVAAQAQTVTGTQNIAFGRINRSGTGSIDYSSPLAARFTVTGRQGRIVRITVTASSLNNGGTTLPITINQDDCAYSIDDGNTWRVFTTGMRFQDVEIPNGISNGSEGTVHIRVGGRVTASNLQNRGLYTGSVTVNATYR